jgi:hypothetical protein
VGLEATEAAGEVDERSGVGGQPQAVDVPDDDPVVTGGAKRSAPGGAARRANPPCRAPSTCTAKRPACRMRCQVSESRDGQNETSGGRSETAANELTISPSGAPSTSVVTKATPVAKRPKAARRLRSSRPGSAGWIA